MRVDNNNISFGIRIKNNSEFNKIVSEWKSNLYSDRDINKALKRIRNCVSDTFELTLTKQENQNTRRLMTVESSNKNNNRVVKELIDTHSASSGVINSPKDIAEQIIYTVKHFITK